jgi:subtilisin-like proprotein convertase family protein
VKITSGTYLRRALFATAATVAVTAAGTAIAAAPPAIPGAPAGATINLSGPAGSPVEFGTEANPFTTSTINVTTPNTYIRDVDVRVRVPHDWSADLDLTLEHNGVTIPLTTDNPDDGEGQEIRAFPNAFANTLFDDFGAQAPSGSGIEDGATTPSAASGAKDPLGLYLTAVPEGPMGRFIGMDPNGTWTLRAEDDEILDNPDTRPAPGPDDPPLDPWVSTEAFFTGQLTGWDLVIQTLPGAPPASQATSHTQSTGAVIGDGATVVSKLTVTGAQRYLTDADLTTNISHNVGAGDLEVRLTSPKGTTTWISNNRGEGSGSALVGTTFDDSADEAFSEAGESPVFGGGTYMPEGAMAAFIGENPNGVWTLTVQDTVPGDSGRLNNWRLDLDSTGGAPPVTTVPTAAPAGFVCKPVPKRPSGGGSGRVLRNGQGMKIAQNQISAAILRLNAINARIKGGFLARDLCGHGFDARDFVSSITWAGGGPTAQAARPSPRPLRFPKLKKKGRQFPFSQRQAGINETLANFVLAKAVRTRARMRALQGGDLRPAAISQPKLAKGLAVVSIGAGTGGTTRSALGRVRFKKLNRRPLTNASLLASQRKTQKAIRIINQITDDINSGLTGRNFKDRSLGGRHLGADITP